MPSCRIDGVERQRRWRDGVERPRRWRDGVERPPRWREGAKTETRRHTGAVAGTVRRCAKLLESLEDELSKPSAGQATDDAGRSETEASDGDDVEHDATPPRHLPEGVVYPVSYTHLTLPTKA